MERDLIFKKEVYEILVESFTKKMIGEMDQKEFKDFFNKLK